MLLLCVAFYRSSLKDTVDPALHDAVTVVSFAPAAVFAWVLFAALWRDVREAASAALAAAAAFVLGLGWMTVLLFLFSWGDPALQLPVLGLPVQLAVAVFAGLALHASRGLPRRGGESRRGAMATIALCIVAAGASAVVMERAKRAPAVATAQESAARAAVRSILACTQRRGAGEAGMPASLRALGPDGEGCVAAQVATGTLSGYRLEYWPGPAADDGLRRTYSLCARPESARAFGRVVIVADERGRIREAAARNMATSRPCPVAWASDAYGVLGAIRQCLHEAAAVDPGAGYPDALTTEVRRCLGPVPQLQVDAAGAVVSQLGSGTMIVRYAPGPRGSRQRSTTYRLYAGCGAARSNEVFDEHGDPVMITAAASRVFANCADIPAGPLDSSPGQTLSEKNEAGPAKADRPAAPVGDNSPDRLFGDVPDLTARRSACARNGADCYDLGRELERQVRIDGGNPNQPQTLDRVARKLLEEANEAYARGCTAAHGKACAAYAEVMLAGRLITQDAPEGGRLLASSCELGYALGCRRWGELLETGRRPMREAQVIVSAQPKGIARPIDAQLPDSSRPGIAADPAAAAKAFESACALGDDDGCLLAARLLRAQPGGQDRALRLYAASCERGDAWACAAAAEVAAEVPGTPTGSPEEFRRRACGLGATAACAP